MRKQFTLSKQERLKSRKRIEGLFRKGTRFNLSSLSVIYTFEQSIESSLQFAAGASSRNFKKAVDRNLIKRRMRECWRLQKIALQEKINTKGLQLFVFINYTGLEIPEYHPLFESMGKVINKLEKMEPAFK